MLCQYCEAARYCQKCYDSKHVPFGTGSSQGWRTLIVCTFSGPSSCSVSRRLLHYVTSSIKMLAFVKNSALPFPLLKECTFCRTCTIKCVWSKCIVKRSFFDARFGGNQKRLWESMLPKRPLEHQNVGSCGTHSCHDLSFTPIAVVFEW